MQISAFVDGELPQNESELLLRRLCQDRELRQQAAEYLAMGRVIRGERMVAGMSVLRERIAAELDEPGFEDEVADETPSAPRFMRPLAGVAIAATVAIVAIIGLQQAPVETTGGEPGVATTAEAADDSYTVPSNADDPLQDYARSHNASASFIGANSFNARLVTYEVEDELPAEEQQEAVEDGSDDDADPAAETTAP